MSEPQSTAPKGQIAEDWRHFSPDKHHSVAAPGSFQTLGMLCLNHMDTPEQVSSHLQDCDSHMFLSKAYEWPILCHRLLHNLEVQNGAASAHPWMLSF